MFALKPQSVFNLFHGREIHKIRSWINVLEFHFNDSWVEFYAPKHKLQITIPRIQYPTILDDFQLHLQNSFLSIPRRIYSVVLNNAQMIMFESPCDLKYKVHQYTTPTATNISTFVDTTVLHGEVCSEFDVYANTLNNIYAICIDVILKLEHELPLQDNDVKYLKQLFECLDFFNKRKEFLVHFTDIVQERILTTLRIQ